MKTCFNLENDLIYVNHAAVSPWPVATTNAVKRFAEENERLGSRNYNEWLKAEQRLRESLRSMINARSTDEIALLKSTSEGLSVIAYGLDWRAGDNIITAAEEFPSNRIVWESLRDFGVEIRLADLESNISPEQALIERMDENTRLLSISSVQYTSGRRMDLQTLGAACKANGTLFCVDAIQSIGALQFDVEHIQADFVAADGHKWMLGPEGLALFYCRQEHLPRLKLRQFGWHMVQNHADFDAMTSWQPATSARRFECGSPNMLGIHALLASLDVLEAVNMAEVERGVLNNARYLMDNLPQIPDVELLTPDTEGRYGGIVTFRINGVESNTLYRYLQQHKVVCAQRGGGIRFSPHFYTERQKLDRLLELVKNFREDN